MDMTKKEEFCFSLFCNFTRHLCRQLAVEILFTKFTKESFFFSEDVFLNFCRNASYNDFWESFMTWINLKIGFQVASVLWLGSSNFGVSCFFLLLGSLACALLGESDIEVSFGLCFGDNFQPFFSPQAKDGMFAQNSEEIEANKFFPRPAAAKAPPGNQTRQMWQTSVDH